MHPLCIEIIVYFVICLIGIRFYYLVILMRGFSPCLVHHTRMRTSKYIYILCYWSLCSPWLGDFLGLGSYWKVKEYVLTTRQQFNVQLICCWITLRVILEVVFEGEKNHKRMGGGGLNCVFVFKKLFFLTFWKTVPRFRVLVQRIESRRTQKERTQAIIQVLSKNRK